MSLLSAVLGIALILIVLGDAFETIVLSRRVTRRVRLARLFYKYTWRPWSASVRSIFSRRRQETYLGFYAPLSLLLLLILWATGLIIGFGLLHWASGSTIKTPDGTSSLSTYLYLSGTTFFTLGLGDVIPATSLGRGLIAFESGMGFGFLALVIGYLPVLNQSFSRREIPISLLDGPARSPHPLQPRCCADTATTVEWKTFGSFFMSGNAGRRSCSKTTCLTPCSAIFVLITITNPGWVPSQPFWIPAPSSLSVWRPPVSVKPN